MPNTGKYWFAIYHPHYNNKQVNNSNRTFVCAANCLYFRYNLNNLSMAFLFTHDGKAYTTK